MDITNYCHIWILNYGELARPLYKLVTETRLVRLVWSPGTQKAFRALQAALLQAPALCLPTESEFNLFVTETKGIALLSDDTTLRSSPETYSFYCFASA